MAVEARTAHDAPLIRAFTPFATELWLRAGMRAVETAWLVFVCVSLGASMTSEGTGLPTCLLTCVCVCVHSDAAGRATAYRTSPFAIATASHLHHQKIAHP